jgi:O-antigen/teichoic acid export membrane protein
MGHLLAAKEDVSRLMERLVGMAVVASGVILTGLAGSSPGLITGLLGNQWSGVSSVVPSVCLAFGVAGSLSVATVGYLYAVGDASAVLRAHILRTIALFAVALPLLPFIGVRAIGLGWLASSLADAAVLVTASRAHVDVHLIRPIVVPVLIGIGSATVGWLVADITGQNLQSGIAGGCCSVSLFVAILFVVRGKLLRETVRFTVGSMRHAIAPATISA